MLPTFQSPRDTLKMPRFFSQLAVSHTMQEIAVAPRKAYCTLDEISHKIVGNKIPLNPQKLRKFFQDLVKFPTEIFPFLTWCQN